jgi:hypothetical protein
MWLVLEPRGESRVERSLERDCIFGSDFTQQVKELGIQEVLGGPRAPQQCANVER